jgi:hypothetical protein
MAKKQPIEVAAPVAAPAPVVVEAPKLDIATTVTGEEYARLVNVKQLKALIKTAGLRMAGDLPAALVLEVGKLVEKAAGRCVGDKRATIQPQDL